MRHKQDTKRRHEMEALKEDIKRKTLKGDIKQETLKGDAKMRH